MRLNELNSAARSTKGRRRRGRGTASGLGKTGGRGHKGQKSRSGGGIRRGFEGGQMPLQRRLPKFGFSSRCSITRQELKIDTLEKIRESVVSVETLRSYGLIKRNVVDVKMFGGIVLARSFTVRGIRLSAGARAAIEGANGTVED